MARGKGAGIQAGDDLNIGFIGTSHAAQHLSAAAKAKGFWIVPFYDADLVFISEDTPTDEQGVRDLRPIREMVAAAARGWQGSPIVLTSQVPPGFTRSLGIAHLFHQAETLRIIDAAERARRPEMLIVGSKDARDGIPAAYRSYLESFGCPVLRMTWEEAEFAKVAINMTLAAQVENTNRLASAAAKVGARWDVIAGVLRHDGRIGPKAYLTPGRWQDSQHLRRDALTLQEILR